MKQKVYGFSLIEVALVIAIAGLIFAMTFAILPGILANQRDSARRDDMITFISTLKEYQQNNSRGALPTPTTSEQDLLKNNKRFTVSGDQVITDKTATVKTFPDTSWGGFYRDYFTTAFEDPSGHPYNLEIMNCELSTSKISLGDSCNATNLATDIAKKYDMRNPDPTIFILLGASCDGADPVKAASPRKIAVVYRLERADAYCIAN